jgi:hypothetical protein
MTVEAVLGEIMGRKIGCTGGVGGSMHLSSIDVGVLPTSAIVGGGLPIAAVYFAQSSCPSHPQRLNIPTQPVRAPVPLIPIPPRPGR